MAVPLKPNLTGNIVQWDRAKGYGFLQVGEERVFLHWRDFIQTRRRPCVGDEIEFSGGVDAKGRRCAQNAVFADGRPGRPGGSGLLVVLVAWPVLLFLPVKAALAQGLAAHWIAAYLIGLSSVSYLLFKTDKRRSQANDWRIPERRLHLVELLGGWPGALLAQRRLRHKSSKFRYQFTFWLIVGAYQFAAFDSIQHWQWSKSALERWERSELPRRS